MTKQNLLVLALIRSMNNIIFKNLGLMVDCSRNSILNMNSIKKLIKYMSIMGYSSLQLYTEDTYEVEDEPYFGYLRGKYTGKEIREIDKFAKENDVELIPCVQTLAHLSKIFRWKTYSNINDVDDILLIDDERTYALIENIFRSLAKNFSSRKVNIGMDEATLVGLGNYLNKHGYQNRSDLMIKHVTKVCSIAEKYGFSCMMWSDMFFKLAYNGIYYTNEIKVPSNDISQLIPSNLTLIYWDYYHTKVSEYDVMIKNHLNINKKVVFAGGAWSWTGLVPSNSFTLQTMLPAFEAFKNYKFEFGFITLWGDDGGSCSPFSMLPSLFMISRFNQCKTDTLLIKKEFAQVFHISYDDFIQVDLPNVIHMEDLNKNYNPSKYLLYNDLLLGIFDSTISINDGNIFINYSKRLNKLRNNDEWGYIFKPLKSLCDVLSYKADLGLLTRKYYQESNKDGLKELILQKYNPLINKLHVFYKELNSYWEIVYKPFGFEVIDFRIGGLIQRVIHIKNKLKDYIDGKINIIEELNELILDFNGGCAIHEHKSIVYNRFSTTITVNSL